MRNKAFWSLVILFLVCSSALFAAPDPKFLTIGTAGSGGAYYPIGIAMADIITNKVGIQTTAQITGGAIENNSLINSRVVDLAISQGSTSFKAYQGLPPYKQKLTNVQGMISGLSQGVFQLVVHKNSPIKSIKDIKGKKISLGPAGGGAITTFLEVISAYGYTEKDFQAVYTSYEQASDALVDGNVDAIVVQAALPTPSITQLTAAKKPVRFISIEEEALKRLMAKYAYFAKLTIPKEVYGTDEPVNTFYIANIVVVSKSLSTDLVYRITKAMFENLDTIHKSHPSVKGLTLETAVAGMPIPWHPGAAKYYKEKGLLK
ncbi:MAG: TAXI family TRAP transporter solute-binding subunit [Firmicutes bacterium]|nr:TAXI family TRAP transporter solute-binding subunit [Bacillota bacterium]